MLKIGRRPYQDCAYRWSLSTAGISVGEGDCSDAQCADLNGDFELDFSACLSKHGKLVWSGDCEEGGTNDCGTYLMEVSGVSGFDCAAEYNGSYVMRPQIINDGIESQCMWTCKRLSSALHIDSTDCECLPPVEFGSGISNNNSAYTFFGGSLGTLFFGHLYAGTGTPSPVLYRRTTPASPAGVVSAPIVEFERYGNVICGTWPDTITATLIGSGGTTGPETNGRIRSKWHLEYDIEATLWTLRSFNRIDYPIYTLSDASPCDGDTKTLLLADKGDAADGCGVAPAEVTITRVCPPDRVGKSALLEDRKPNGATGKRKRQCGCDCLDEVDDRRHTCETKCASTESEGCGDINPAPDDITCRFPEAINCCDNTAGKDVPCAYVVEFECDIHYGEGYDRIEIAAKQVTLRRKCYFEDGCEFVAVGPSGNAADGGTGAQPVCASCADDCLTGCTWDAWNVAACPASCDNCVDVCVQTDCWSANVSSFAIPGVTTVVMTPQIGSPHWAWDGIDEDSNPVRVFFAPATGVTTSGAAIGIPGNPCATAGVVYEGTTTTLQRNTAGNCDCPSPQTFIAYEGLGVPSTTDTRTIVVTIVDCQ